MVDNGLATESIDRGAKRLVKIHPGQQPFITIHLVDARPKYDALHNVRRAQVPDLAGEHDVVGAVHLGPVIPGTRQPRERQASLSSAKLDFKKALGDIHRRRSVLTHGS